MNHSTPVTAGRASQYGESPERHSMQRSLSPKERDGQPERRLAETVLPLPASLAPRCQPSAWRNKLQHYTSIRMWLMCGTLAGCLMLCESSVVTKGRCDEEHMTAAITARLLADSTRRPSTNHSSSPSDIERRHARGAGGVVRGGGLLGGRGRGGAHPAERERRSAGACKECAGATWTLC